MPTQPVQDPEENLPDWLRALRKRQSQEPSEGLGAENAPSDLPAAASEPEPRQEPSWLQEIRARYKKTTGSLPATEGTELGDTQPHRVKAADQAPVEETPAAEETQPPMEEPQAVKETPPAFEEEIPESQDEESGAEETIKPSYTPAFTEDQVPIDPGVLPSWLQALRPGGSYPTEDARSGEMLPGVEETSGPLAGLSDVLPADASIARVEKPPVYSARLEVTENQGLHAAVFIKMLDETEPPPVDEAHRVARPTRVLNLIMATVLFLSVLFPLVTQSQTAGLPDPQLFPEATNVYSLIDGLPAGAPVLVAFEVQPALNGEITPLAIAILGHLLDRQAQLVFISTRPSGPALAERMLQEQFSAVPAVATGAYTQLGYLSGGLAALRSFISDPRGATLSTMSAGADAWQDSSLDPIRGINSFALIVVVSSNAEDARAWIEQGAGVLPNGLVAVTSAQAAPLLRAYLQSDPLTLLGLVSGIQGAALYERLRAQDGGLGRAYWDAYSYGIGAIMLLILLGGLYGRLIRMKPEKPITSGAARGT